MVFVFQSHSDDSGGEGHKRKRPSIWQLVKSNLYTHRKRKVQDEDDIMICQCTLSGDKGCDPDCINRMLNLECVPVSWPGRVSASSLV